MPSFVEILGNRVYSGNIEGIIVELESHLATKAQFKVFCINPHSHVTSKDNLRLKSALEHADALIPDGAGIILASKVLKKPLPKRITGSDLFEAVCRWSNETGRGRHFFLGSSPETLDRIRIRISELYPNLQIAGTHSPPFTKSLDFSDSENEAMVKAINDSNADILWVAMTAPKQEVWINENASKINATLFAPIGAVFDFFVGNVKRSPDWFCNHGLEWLPRLIQEPKRLLKRNFVSTPIFLKDIAIEYLSQQLRLKR